ncbi:amidophosphoribosyltransferase [Mariniblastus fucicola]|uniref:Amidophosphoribosyltransferase n=1 Tax=Mariniblastus fucicola TaxID=980251 RepID=A0A5B9PGD5_9BACT|nr:amidophosphoribosyltransferase [Mariniblastus fucicola]QEG24295.1 Amidophosphoribosyltransferase [Mariniblastus fucicola]
MSELFHECGVAAIYHLPSETTSELCPGSDPQQTSSLIVRMLLDMQNRGQLSAGISRFNENATNHQLIDTYRDLGSVQEVFRLSHKAKAKNLMSEYVGPVAIGHVRYATCGADDKSYAQPFENHHFNKRRWFSFAFNGQLANFNELAQELLSEPDTHLVRNSDTEVLMHEFSRQLLQDSQISLIDMIRNVSRRLDGAWSLAYLNAKGEMLIARDPLGIKPMCYAVKGPLFAAASESVALVNLGFSRSEIESLKPGHAITIVDGKIEITQFADDPGQAHCFFEWIYFANVASRLDDRGVYQTRTELGRELADLERDRWNLFEVDEDTIVVPVPDTSKAAADSMAFHMKIPSREGLIRNRYSGRTFIESSQESRAHKAKIKYTPLREVMEGKRVVLVEDSIVRSTTMQALLQRIRDEGGAKEIHVRVACPPIMAPCYYGIDMSTIRQLFAPKFCPPGKELTEAMQDEMAAKLGCDSLRYLPIESISRAIGIPEDGLCQACLTGQYPTPTGQKLYQIDKDNFLNDRDAVDLFAGRAFDVNAS